MGRKKIADEVESIKEKIVDEVESVKEKIVDEVENVAKKFTRDDLYKLRMSRLASARNANKFKNK